MLKFLHLFLIFFLSANLASGQSDLKSEALKFWAKRDEKESLSQAIVKFEQLHQERPEDQEVLIYLLRSLFLLGDFHISEKDQKLKIFQRAFDIGEKALLINAHFAEKIKKGNDPQECAKSLTANEAPILFWTAANIGKFAKTNGIFASIKYKSKILAYVSRVEQLRPDYFFGAVPRYWGSYFAVIPRLAGRNLKKSKKYFEQSLAMAPEYLGTKVLQAETYFVENDDKDGFKKILTSVIEESTLDKHPELGPENRMEKIKAKQLLDQAGDLF